MEWTTEGPTVPGYYWVYTVPEHEDKPKIYCVEVGILGGKLFFNFQVNGYEWEEEISAERTTHWMGPLDEPRPPVVEDETTVKEGVHTVQDDVVRCARCGMEFIFFNGIVPEACPSCKYVW